MDYQLRNGGWKFTLFSNLDNQNGGKQRWKKKTRNTIHGLPKENPHPFVFLSFLPLISFLLPPFLFFTLGSFFPMVIPFLSFNQNIANLLLIVLRAYIELRADVASFSCMVEAWSCMGLHRNAWKRLILCFGQNRQWLFAVLLLNTLQYFSPHFLDKYPINARLIFTKTRLK